MPSIAAIKIAQKSAGLDDAHYRALLRKVAGVDSCKDLDGDGRLRVYRALVRMSRTSGWSRPATPSAQMKMVYGLFYRVRARQGGISNPDAYLRGLVRQTLRREDLPDDLGELSTGDLQKVIEALKQRLAQPCRTPRAPRCNTRQDL